MAGEIRVDADGVSNAVRQLTSREEAASEYGASVESAMSDAQAAVRTAALVSAVSGLSSRFNGKVTDVANYVGRLSNGVRSVAETFSDADQQMAASARKLEAR